MTRIVILWMIVVTSKAYGVTFKDVGLLDAEHVKGHLATTFHMNKTLNDNTKILNIGPRRKLT